MKKNNEKDSYCHYSDLPSPMAYVQKNKEKNIKNMNNNETYSIPIHENGIKTEWTVDGVIGDEKYFELLKFGNGKDLPDIINTTTNER